MAHDFAKKHFHKPTWCAYCEKFIWGLGKQGFLCKNCDYPCHPKCIFLVPANCKSVKTSWALKSLDEAKKATETQQPHPQSSLKNSLRTSKKVDFDPRKVLDVKDSEEELPVPEPAKQPKKRPPAEPSLLRLTGGGLKKKVADRMEDVYDILEELGSGAFATVYKVRNKESGQYYAAKVILKHNTMSDDDLDRLAVEMDILSSIKHPNIIELKEIFETEEKLYIVMELVTGGELFDRIVSRGTYTESDAALLIRHIIEGLEYLHSRDIIHRDLKPENLLLQSTENDTDVKIADFGLSKILSAGAMTQTACGTPSYVAPEVLKGKKYGPAVDMWSVGVIGYILLSGIPPFYNEKVPLLFESIMRCDFDYPAEYWDSVSDTALDFIDSLLVAQPNHRLTATQALQHPWLKGAAPNTLLPKVSKSMSIYKSKQNFINHGPTRAE